MSVEDIFRTDSLNGMHVIAVALIGLLLFLVNLMRGKKADAEEE